MTTAKKLRLAGMFMLAMFFAHISLNAQKTPSTSAFTQTIRGTVTDQVLQKPLAGATVTIVGLDKHAITNEEGIFRFRDVPVSTYHVLVTNIGYKDALLENIMVNSGKEVVLNIALELSLAEEKEVEVVAKTRKNRPLNDMSLVSARAFTVEETRRYAAAVNDPLRMASSFAGVISADDGNNDIVIRGNSPAGLLWRMEGVDIPNPNHFSNAGSSGGGISILSSQLLDNSDFVTGAFTAEYGNALSGVFDLRLRKGNNEKREYTAEAGLLGLNVAAEGPLMPFYKGSFLVNYRYSTLQLLKDFGVNVGPGVTNFQDLSFNIYLPTARKGDFTIFGFGGLSDQTNTNETDSTKWDSEDDRYGGRFKSNTAATGITHNISVSGQAQVHSAVSYSFAENDYNENYTMSDGSLLNSFRNTYRTRKIVASSTLNYQFSRKTILRSGIIGTVIHYDYYQKSREHTGDPVLERINSSDRTTTMQGHAQVNHRFTEKLSAQAGLHLLHLFLNKTSSAEPRAAVRYRVDARNTVSVGYGLHSQLQALGVYFAKSINDDGSYNFPNKNLSFTKAHHFVFSYTHSFRQNLRFRGELYYQHLFNVPVSSDESLAFSTLNIRGDYVTEALVNAGNGKNYGLELSLEKNLSNNYYFLLNQSIFSSRYTAKDGIERNTRFNSNRVTNFTGGREIVLKDGKKVIGLNIKLIYAGGFRTTPIDVEASAQKGYTVYFEKQAFSIQNPAYFRTDIRFSMKWNRLHHTSLLSLDIQNVSNRQNIYGTFYDAQKKEVVYSYQTGLIPVLNFKVEF